MIEEITLRGSYRFYRQENERVLSPEELSKYKNSAKTPMDELTYNKIVVDMFDMVVDKLLSGYDVKLGGKLGVLGIRGTKKALRIWVDKITGEEKIVGSVNWGDTNKLWARNEEAKKEKRLIFFDNEHTNGIRYRLYWSKQNIIFRNKTYYELRPAATFLDRLGAAIKRGQEFIELLPKVKTNKNGKHKETIPVEENVNNCQD